MAVSFTKPYLLLFHHHHHPNLSFISKPKSRIRSTIENNNNPKQVSPSGQGFGDKSNNNNNKKSVIRRNPVEKPAFLSKGDGEAANNETQSLSESAFIVIWLGLGGLILLQGLTLAASGFLPEEWDKLFVKYVYPSFTPTVGLFLAGTTAYGVLKYLQNEKLKG
ncbi:hypothetical protein ACFE04_004455 [Oxalis oulophora]